jgi:hypothetical protein
VGLVCRKSGPTVYDKRYKLFNLLKPTGIVTYHKDRIILHCDYMEFVRFVWISEQTANLDLCNMKRLVFITEVESVYSAVRTESLYNTDNVPSLKG